ncbi:hypothetical protein SESBI_14518 [Sesbania bispinosa]|nr:hypothetical protein SESBI_14518 [Sesbania bispinosa]
MTVVGCCAQMEGEDSWTVHWRMMLRAAVVEQSDDSHGGCTVKMNPVAVSAAGSGWNVQGREERMYRDNGWNLLFYFLLPYLIQLLAYVTEN